MTNESREASASATAQKIWASAITEAGYWRFEETAIIELGKAIIERTTRIIDDLRARLAAMEQERDDGKERHRETERDACMWAERCQAAERERDKLKEGFADVSRALGSVAQAEKIGYMLGIADTRAERDAALAEVKAVEQERDDYKGERNAALEAIKAQLITMSARRDLAVHERDAALAKVKALREALHRVRTQASPWQEAVIHTALAALDAKDK